MQAHVVSVLDIKQGDSNDGNINERADEVVDGLIDSAMNTQASLCIIPMQDVLHLDSGARMNTPGIANGNWHWSFQWQQLEDKIITNMRQRIEKADRVVKSNV